MKYIHFGTNQINVNIEYTQNPKRYNRVMNKPNGLWSCELRDIDGEYRSEWERFSHCEMGSKTSEFTIFEISENAKILKIDSIEDVMNLEDKYFLVKEIDENYRQGGNLVELYLEILKNMMKDNGSQIIPHNEIQEEIQNQFEKDMNAKRNTKVVFDFGQIQKDYDMLKVSSEGVIEMSEIFYMWDVESSVIFNLNIIVIN